jgi:hypothetical protein
VSSQTMNNFSNIIHLFPPNLACFAPWRESSPLIEISPHVMSNNKCLHLSGTTLAFYKPGRGESTHEALRPLKPS